MHQRREIRIGQCSDNLYVSFLANSIVADTNREARVIIVVQIVDASDNAGSDQIGTSLVLIDKVLHDVTSRNSNIGNAEGMPTGTNDDERSALVGVHVSTTACCN